MGAGWDPPMSMCQLDPPCFPLTPASPSWGLRTPPIWVPVTRVLRRSGSYFGPFPGTGCFLGNHRAEKVKLPGQGGHRHAGYFRHHRHRHGEGQRSRGSSTMAGTDGQQEGWTLSWGWHGWARACPPRHRCPPSPAVGTTGVMLEEVPSPLPARSRLGSDPGPFPGTVLASRHRCGQGECGGSWHLPGVSTGASTGGGGGKRVKVWHWILAAPLFSWPWRSCLPPPPPPGAEPSSWPCARTGCWRLRGGSVRGPGVAGEGSSAPPGGGPGSPPWEHIHLPPG